jgi:predicted nucleic acid-binding protein
MRAALDTNVLAYAEGIGDTQRCAVARTLIAPLTPEATVVPVQVLEKLSRLLTIKARCPAAAGREAVIGWSDCLALADSSWPDFEAALDLMVDHRIPDCEALILAVAAAQRCRVLVSEDFHPGFTWRGLTVVSAFTDTPATLLEATLRRG